MANPLIPVNTIRYKTYLKETLVEALRFVFEDHVDVLLQKTKIDIDNPTDQESYPAIIVRFYERSITNAGVGHEEYLPIDEEEVFWQKFRHSFYSGDIEFAVYALSSYDRDLISDSLVQILSMGDTEDYTSQFLSRIYDVSPTEKPTSLDHFVNINTDSIQGFGETQTTPPWGPEDVLVYQTSYRIGVWGEFYSLTRPQTYVLIERVEQYPYLQDARTIIPDGPIGVTATPSTTGGALGAGTYFYKVTSLNYAGESMGSEEVQVDTTGTTGSVSIAWAEDPKATSYRVYRGTLSNYQGTYYSVTGPSFVDIGDPGGSGYPPPIPNPGPVEPPWPA